MWWVWFVAIALVSFRTQFHNHHKWLIELKKLKLGIIGQQLEAHPIHRGKDPGLSVVNVAHMDLSCNDQVHSWVKPTMVQYKCNRMRVDLVKPQLRGYNWSNIVNHPNQGIWLQLSQRLIYIEGPFQMELHSIFQKFFVLIGDATISKSYGKKIKRRMKIASTFIK